VKTDLTAETFIANYPPNDNAPDCQPQYHDTASMRRAYEEQAVNNALKDVFGNTKHRWQKPPDTPPAQMVDYGVAGTSDIENVHVVTSVNPVTGTLVLAEGTGSRVAAEATARGFQRAMEAKQTHRAGFATTAGNIQDTLQRAIPNVIAKAQAELGTSANKTNATALAVQITGNLLVYTGDRPLYVYNEAGECKRLIYGTVNTGSRHVLEPGRNIIIMSGGRATDDDLPCTAIVGEKLRTILGQPAAQEAKNTEATRIAEELRHALASGQSAGTLMVAIANVNSSAKARPETAPKPSQLIRRTSGLANLALAKLMLPNHSEHNPEANDNPSRKRRAVIGKLAANTAALGVGYGLVRETLALSGRIHLPHLGFLEHHSSPLNTNLLLANKPSHTQLTGSTGITIGLEANHPAPHGTPFPNTYTALSHDTANGGRPTNVSSISRQVLASYGRQAGMSQVDIQRITHDDTLIGRLNTAFMHDKHNPQNRLVRYDRSHFLNNRSTYSTQDQATMAQKIIASHMHQSAPTRPAPLPTVPAAPASPLPKGPLNIANNIPPPHRLIGTEHGSSHLLTLIDVVGIAGVGTAAVRALHSQNVQKAYADARRELHLDGNLHVRMHGKGRRYDILKKTGLFRPDMIGKEPAPTPNKGSFLKRLGHSQKELRNNSPWANTD